MNFLKSKLDMYLYNVIFMIFYLIIKKIKYNKNIYFILNLFTHIPKTLDLNQKF